MLLEASRDPDSAPGRALDTAMAVAADVTFKDVVREACRAATTSWPGPTGAGSVEAAIAELSRRSASNAGEPRERRARDRRRTANRRRRNGRPSPTPSQRQQDRAEAGAGFATALALAGREAGGEYLGVFFTDRASAAQERGNQKIRRRSIPLAGAVDADQERVCALLIAPPRADDRRDRTRRCSHRRRGAANYRREKAGARPARLRRSDRQDARDAGRNAAGWVHYKLDRGIDHVLIDEAQDTSPQQWDIVSNRRRIHRRRRRARRRPRTVFAVGDEKQSIYSFQGAAPHEFDAMRRYFAAPFDAGAGCASCAFDHSFRSGVSILAAVDQVFARKSPAASHSIDGYPPHHRSRRTARPGRTLGTDRAG